MLARGMTVLAAVCLAFPLAAREWTVDEKAVWHLEESYWRFVSAGDVDSYVKLWHDDFVGWPCFEWNPARKGALANGFATFATTGGNCPTS